MEFFRQNIIPGEVLVQLLAFGIVFWTLKLLAWKPLQQALEARREKIRSDFEKIETTKKEIEALRADYNTHLQRIEDEARAKIQEAVAEGRKISREIQDKARAESQATFEKAKETIEIEIDKARLELRREIVALAIGASERILKEKMDDPKQQDKVSKIIEELEKSL